MVFSGVPFLFYFFPAFLILYFISGKRLKNYVLLFASLIFYAWGEPVYVLIMLASIAINYAFTLLIASSKTQTGRKAFLFINICADLGILFFFKYVDLFIDMVNKALRICGTGLTLNSLNIALPIGLSFFTFQGMSYVIDVYRGDVPVQKNILKLALYISMFPQLIAGPIVRYSDVMKEIDERSVSFDDICEGVSRFIIGLSKKVMIADVLSVVSDRIFEAGAYQLTPSVAWLGAVCYSLQILFDFSGYSDMAIGMGRMMGFHFPENFDMPYISSSITEFWRRWHMTLGSWFKDYLYIPLGGNRRGNIYVNLMIVFLLTGLWHGANYTFIFWGIWHGFFRISELFLKKHFPDVKVPGVIRHIYTMLAVVLGWVFFRSPGLGSGVRYIRSMFGLLKLDDYIFFGFPYYVDAQIIVTIIAAVLISLGVFKRLKELAMKNGGASVMKALRYPALVALLVTSAVMIINGNYSPFIYFRF